MFFRFMLTISGITGGILTYYLLPSLFIDLPWILHLGAALIGAVAGIFLGRFFYRNVWTRMEETFQKATVSELLAGSLGLLFGLIVAGLIIISLPITKLSGPAGNFLALLIILFSAGMATRITLKKREEIFSFFGALPKGIDRKQQKGRANSRVSYKILDTSTIIDGRILDICQTGFLEGILIVPGFVLTELQRIADSSDSLKRNRGRRGLDILNKMQKEPNVSIRIYDQDFDDVSDVDIKLVRLARVLEAKVITNDYNLNKVAELYGVSVLNINELANAIKPIILPGEEVMVQVVKDGKEYGQGVAYLEDGTMIVVDGGRQFIGEEVTVSVTSVLQTAAGRMIFAKPKESIAPKASSIS